ncbi:MAG: hypothetical protein IJ770_05560 [Alphaproteobacteria bacterium]|nr:hypothetical protein [Alphaproteobacteria bacterium]
MAKLNIQPQDMAELYKKQYGKEITFTGVRIFKKGIIGFRKIYAIASIVEQSTMPANEYASAHTFSTAQYYMVPIIKRMLQHQGILFSIKSYDAHLGYTYNQGETKEIWRTTEVFMKILSGNSELVNIRSSGTGDTPYIDVTNNVQVKVWLDRKIPFYDFLIATGLSDEEKSCMNDADIKKRRNIIYKFAQEFFRTYILSKADIKANQERIKQQIRAEAEKRKAEQMEARRIAQAEKRAWEEQRAAAKVKVYLDDESSQSKKELMKTLVGEDIFED